MWQLCAGLGWRHFPRMIICKLQALHLRGWGKRWQTQFMCMQQNQEPRWQDMQIKNPSNFKLWKLVSWIYGNEMWYYRLATALVVDFFSPFVVDWLSFFVESLYNPVSYKKESSRIHWGFYHIDRYRSHLIIHLFIALPANESHHLVGWWCHRMVIIAVD